MTIENKQEEITFLKWVVKWFWRRKEKWYFQVWDKIYHKNWNYLWEIAGIDNYLWIVSLDILREDSWQLMSFSKEEAKRYVVCKFWKIKRKNEQWEYQEVEYWE